MEVGVDWVVCEQDTTEKEVKVSITESREYLRLHRLVAASQLLLQLPQRMNEIDEDYNDAS